jgi:hemolysin activation/secretion protein
MTFLSNPFLKCFCIFLGIQMQVIAQKLTILPSLDLDSKEFVKLLNKSIIKDSSQLHVESKRILNDYIAQGFLLSSIDSMYARDSKWLIQFSKGNKFKIAAINYDSIQLDILQSCGIIPPKNKLLPTQVKIDINKILVYCENHGYPFASIFYKNVEINDSILKADLFLNKNIFITYDTINHNSNTKLSRKYLESYLGIQEGKPYNKSQLLSLSKRCNQLPFLALKQNPTATFWKDKVSINLTTIAKNASKFDFLIGVLPNIVDGVQKFSITGNLNADMYNLLGYGERLSLAFAQLRPESPQLDVKIQYPYVLNTDFGLDFSFNLYKRDSTFLDVKNEIGIQYIFKAESQLKLLYNTFSSSNLSINAASIIQTKQLPSTLDVSQQNIGLEFNLYKLDYLYNPKRGFSINFRILGGKRSIQKNLKILELQSIDGYNYGSLYDTIALSSFQFKSNLKFDYFIPISKLTTFKIGLNSGFIFSEAPIYQNEKYRLGGNRLLRGFDEESFFTSKYAVLTGEYRFLLSTNSNLFAFYDQGFLILKDNALDKPYSVGTGITFETKSGIFGISFAVGATQNIPLDLKSIKTHLGFISIF